MNESVSDHPDFKLEKDKEESGNGLFCFLNETRECGPDCMAYTALPGEALALNSQQKNCVLIVSAERLGRYSAGIVKLLQKAVDGNIDRQRQGKIPDPMGRQ